MIKRKITNLYDVKFVPFDNYGSPIPGMNWHKISYDKKMEDKAPIFLGWIQVQRVYLINILALKNF